MSKTNRAKITLLKLAFPPISNQEAYLLRDQPISDLMRKSDFYMIGGKAKSRFDYHVVCDEKKIINFNIYIGDNLSGNGSLNLLEFCPQENSKITNYQVADKDDYIEFYYDKNDERLIIDRLTPENILWYRSIGRAGIYGLDNYKELMCYDLLYVGIAKTGDSYDRLIKKAHHARLNILANEPQRHPGARVTDEIFLFLFYLEPLFISTFSHDSEIDLDFDYDHKKIVADAEKAFVSLLQPDYNSIRFKEYPKGKDGLFDSKLDRYLYSIAEAITFNTPHGKIKGAQNYFGMVSNEADFIFVDKETSQLFISGKDFDVNPEE